MFISRKELRSIRKSLIESEVTIRGLRLDVKNLRKELIGETTIREDFSSTLNEILGSYYGGKSVSLSLIVENLIDALGYKIDYHPTDPPPQKKVSYLLKKNTKVSKKKEKNKWMI